MYYKYKYFSNEKNKLIVFPLVFILTDTLHDITASTRFVTSIYECFVDYTWGTQNVQNSCRISLKISLVAFPYDHREKTIPSWLCVCNSVIILFSDTNHIGDKIFRSKHELILEKYFNVFEESNT